MIKLVILSAFLAVACADVSHLLRPKFQTYKPAAPAVPSVRSSAGSDQLAVIVRQSSDITPEGSYQWAYETDNGIAAQEQGAVRTLGPEQVSKEAQGSFSWTSPEGVPVGISYVADENGYQPAGDALPTPPPVPAAILKALEWIAAHPAPAESVVVAQRRFQ